jgi:hypothetical protein
MCQEGRGCEFLAGLGFLNEQLLNSQAKEFRSLLIRNFHCLTDSLAGSHTSHWLSSFVPHQL